MGKRGYMVAAVASIVVGASLSAVVAQAAHPWDANPFFGSSEGGSQVTDIIGQAIISESEGDFQATHIGNGTYTAALSQNYPRHVESGMENASGQCAFVDGEIVLTAANGDQINVDVDADRSVTCAPPGQPPTGAAPGDIYTSTIFGEIVGGTGRFADVTGYIFSEGTSEVTGPGTTIDNADVYGDIQIGGE
jgi:hypothetical protein